MLLYKSVTLAARVLMPRNGRKSGVGHPSRIPLKFTPAVALWREWPRPLKSLSSNVRNPTHLPKRLDSELRYRGQHLAEHDAEKAKKDVSMPLPVPAVTAKLLISKLLATHLHWLSLLLISANVTLSPCGLGDRAHKVTLNDSCARSLTSDPFPPRPLKTPIGRLTAVIDFHFAQTRRPWQRCSRSTRRLRSNKAPAMPVPHMMSPEARSRLQHSLGTMFLETRVESLGLLDKARPRRMQIKDQCNLRAAKCAVCVEVGNLSGLENSVAEDGVARDRTIAV
ncbi:hypothetical protein KC365_g23 [Hortaea werneckii]|nr:hypothetical protein KC365_g23 [Hortaea werneckii]